MNKLRTTKLLFLGTAFVAVVVFLSSQVYAYSKPVINQAEVFESVYLENEEYVSPVFDTDFEFNVVGIAWQGEGNVKFDLRFYNGQWSDWFASESSDEFQKDDWKYSTEPVLASQAKQLQYKVATTGTIDQVRIIYLNSTKEKEFNLFDWLFNSASAGEVLDIVTRSEWQADEDWRLNSNGDVSWQPEYQWPEKFVIHHTAGSDGGSDPAATVRGIYYWHASVLGCGDIGYNYLIDQQGNIYEGRFGGDAVNGAHVYRSAICAEQRFGGAEFEADFNKGTIGIAVLGNYDSSLTLNDSVQHALANLIGYKAKEFDIIPNGTSSFIDAVYPNIVTHQDLDCTNCAGKNIINQLDSIRMASQKVFESIGGVTNPVVKATYVGISEQPVEVPTGLEKEIWVDFRNDGNFTWRNYLQETVTVIARNNNSSFYVAGWESPTIVARLDSPNVAPGEIGRFVFTILGPTDQLEVTEEFILQFGEDLISNTAFSITARVTGLEYAGFLDNQNILPASFTGGRHTSTVQYINMGIETWNQGEVKLDVFDLGDKVSRYYDSSWPTSDGGFDFNEASVAPGELATFDFTYRSPDEPGLFLNIYRLSGVEGLVYKEDYSVTRVDSRYQAELDTWDMPPAMLNLWRPTITIRVKNTGIASWDSNVGLQILDISGKISRFYDASWDDIRIATHLNEASVKSGEIGSFTLKVKPPLDPGKYYNLFRVFNNGLPVPGGEFIMVTRVDK